MSAFPTFRLLSGVVERAPDGRVEHHLDGEQEQQHAATDLEGIDTDAEDAQQCTTQTAKTN
jgi:hypothetical protein